MKKFVYVFIGMAIALGAVLLYSFKNSEQELSQCVIIKQENGTDIFIYYSNGRIESAEELLSFEIGKKGYSLEGGFTKTIEHFYLNGYKIIEESNYNGTHGDVRTFTLIKEN